MTKRSETKKPETKRSEASGAGASATGARPTRSRPKARSRGGRRPPGTARAIPWLTLEAISTAVFTAAAWWLTLSAMTAMMGQGRPVAVFWTLAVMVIVVLATTALAHLWAKQAYAALVGFGLFALYDLARSSGPLLNGAEITWWLYFMLPVVVFYLSAASAFRRRRRRR